MRLFITGGCGFVGASLTRQAIAYGFNVFNVDLQNKAQSVPQLEGCNTSKSYSQLIGDANDSVMLCALLKEFKPNAFIHCAGGVSWKKGIPTTQGTTATIGVLQAVQTYVSTLSKDDRSNFRFVVPFETSAFGSLSGYNAEFSGMNPIAPNTIQGGRASLDLMLINGWSLETGIPVIFGGASALYGKWQQAEAFIPSLIRDALNLESTTLARAHDTLDWLHIDDFTKGLLGACLKGQLGDTYLFSARTERRNKDIANNVMTILDGFVPQANNQTYRSLLNDTPNNLNSTGLRCALDPKDAETKLNWNSKHNLLLSLRETVAWYVERISPQTPTHINKAGNEDFSASSLAAE